jgi:ATP-dependent DNA helicase HFM1/MER3
MLQALQQAGINSFAKLLESDPRRLESLTGRKYPFGNHVKESLEALPPTVDIKLLNTSYSRQGIHYTIQLTRTSPTKQYTKKHFADLVSFPEAYFYSSLVSSIFIVFSHSLIGNSCRL